jgi:hypothetical protein
MTGFILDQGVKERFERFLKDVLAAAPEKIHSAYITGSALTSDFNPKHSDINSVLVITEMDLRLIENLAPLGKKYGKKGIASPLILSGDHIRSSLDVFPIEFLTLKRLHACVFGKDVFNGITIRLPDLRAQCEREVKIKLIGLRQAYLGAAGDRKQVADIFTRTFSGYIPLFGAILVLLGRTPPMTGKEMLENIEKYTGTRMDCFLQVFQGKKKGFRLPLAQLNRIFEEYCGALEKLGDIVDAWQAG